MFWSRTVQRVLLHPCVLAAMAEVGRVSALTGVNTTAYINDVFDTSMSYLDQIYDPAAGYLWYTYYPFAAGKHETRSTVWYAAGLLRRNEGRDVDEAVRILTSVIGDQKKNVSDQWFGDYTKYPEEPTVGTAWYPESIYNTWDPNWRGFIATTLIVIYEEYGALLPPPTRALILASLRNSTLGDSYRVGGVDGDNLYPAYSNPSLMRAVVAGWTGRRLHDRNMTAAGEADATALVALFDRNDTLSEFNSPTYCGVSLYALTLWAKYLPAKGNGSGNGNGTQEEEEASVMGAQAPRMIAAIWTTVGQLYNANLRNIAGPWDRTYGFDMNQYVGIMNIYIWSLVGLARAPNPNAVSSSSSSSNSQGQGQGRTPYWATNHADDFEIAPLLATLLPYHHTLVPPAARASLVAFPGPHTYTTAAYSPPYDRVPRNVTAWLSARLALGAESFDQTVVGGFSVNPSSWSPAVAQWARPDGSVGWFKWYSTEAALDVDVAPGATTGATEEEEKGGEEESGHLGLTYPRGNQSSVFTILVASNPLGQTRDILGWEDVWGVSVNVSGTVDLTPAISFCGLLGGSCDPINDWEFWNFTYSMPVGSVETPSIAFDIAVA